jgi:hypothetical protein
MKDSKTAHLENFGIRNTTTAQERYAQYVEDCKGLPKRKQAEFWLKIIEHDKEVGRLVKRQGEEKTIGGMEKCGDDRSKY